MLARYQEIEELLRCPRTGAPLERRGDLMTTSDGTGAYRAIGEIPVLIDFQDSVIDEESAGARGMASAVTRPQRKGASAFVKRLLSPDKPGTRRNIAEFIALLRTRADRPVVLVIGGGTIGQGMQALYDDPAIQIVAFDIYYSRNVHFVADAHALPLADGSVDGVVVQAVLEHVLEPARVVSEIHRVLAPNGLVYAETPFLQHVHEGAYDFTRFTESGHRFLFRSFALIRSGVSGGPGTQLLWSIDYFIRSLFRSRIMGKIAKTCFFWLQFADLIIGPTYGSDAASGVFFIGIRSTAEMTSQEAIAFYRGAQ